MKLKIFGFLILVVITNSCANSNKLTTISDGLTQTCIEEKPQWVELADNQGVYRCVSDVETRYTTTTVYVAPKPTATQEQPAITSPKNSGADCKLNSKGDWDCVIARSCFPGSDGLYYEHVKLQSDNSWHPTGAYC